MRALSRLLAGTALAALAGAAAGCGVTTPSSLITEPVFSGTVSPGGVTSSATATFKTQKTGEFILKITSLTPDGGATLTAVYGQPTVDASGNPACALLGSAPAGLNKAAFDQQLPAGTYCVQFSDISAALPRTETFQATIQHS